MPDVQQDLIIIGGGIVGLATALEAVYRFPGIRLLILEKEDRIAAHQSGHNSGVIHSGVYYKPGSIKARTCVEGGAAMIAFCRRHAIPFEVCGKMIVATSQEELPRLDELFRRGKANGVRNLTLLGPEQMREIEPYATGLRALYVPGTGITDYALVTEKYAEIIAGRGAEVRTGAEVTGIQRRNGYTVLETTTGPFSAKYVINCAGLHSDRISQMAGANTEVRIVPFRGEYYEVVPERRHLVKGLIYPVADPRFPFLGVHFTRKVNGGVEAGPNAVFAFRREGYSHWDFNLGETLNALSYGGFWRMARRYWRTGLREMHRSFSKRAFVRALQKLVPELQASDIRPAGSGVRAQALSPNGTLVDDFRFIRTEGMIHVVNVPSPAATASLPIGRTIVDMLASAFDIASPKIHSKR